MWWWKVLGVSLVLLVAGIAGGYAVGHATSGGESRITDAGPVPAVSPSVPTPSSVPTLPDPTNPSLPVDVALQQVHLHTGKHGNGNPLTLDAPAGWTQTQKGPTRWYFTEPGYPLNTFTLRVDVVAGTPQSVEVYQSARIAALHESEKHGDLQDLSVDKSGNTFVSTYVEGGYFRVSEERVLSLDQPTAYVDVAVTGREVDREGLMDLLARVSESMVAE